MVTYQVGVAHQANLVCHAPAGRAGLHCPRWAVDPATILNPEVSLGRPQGVSL